MRVLVIEDETKMAALIRRGPSAKGHAVDVSVRGDGAALGPARFVNHASAAIERLREPVIVVGALSESADDPCARSPDERRYRGRARVKPAPAADRGGAAHRRTVRMRSGWPGCTLMARSCSM